MDALTLSEMSKELETQTLQASDALKAIFRLHASGVAVITAATAQGEPIGFTATSVTSLGSNPPLVSFNIAQGSSSFEHVQKGSLVAIHTLGGQNLDLAQKLAGPREMRFTDIEFVTGPENIPIFPAATGHLIARVRDVFAVESNAVVVLDALSATVTGGNIDPLLYFQRGYLIAGERLSDNF